jgi:hypothetical protein
MTVMRRSGSGRATVALMAAVGLLALAAPASAQPPRTGTGSGTIEIRDISPVREAGGNLIQERSLEGTVTGALVGTYTEEVKGVIHKSGLVTFQGTMEFTGTVEGCGEGTFTLGLSGRGVAGDPVTDATARVINHAANTLNIAGVGTLRQVGLTFTYEVQYVCP